MAIEIMKPNTATSFEDCMSQEHDHLKDKYPDMKDPQKKAVALNVCRKKFPETSKARILRMLEKSAFESEESLDPLIRAIKKSLNREEILEYCVILRQEGYSIPKVAGMIKYKDSWIKKYVNPIFNAVTELEKLELELPEMVTRSTNFRKVLMKATPTSIDEEKREFEAWATVEVEDSEGEIVEAKGISQTMPTYMERGGILLYGHSNRHVGNTLKWKDLHKEVDGKSVPGILLRAKVFNHYKIDDQAWNSVLLAKRLGKPILSIGATPTSDRVDCEGDKCRRVIEKEQLYEITITEMTEGSQGANPEATLERTIEKDHSIASLLKNLYLSRVSSGAEDYQNLLKGGLDEVKASEIILMDVLNKMTPKDEKEKEKSQIPDSDEQKDEDFDVDKADLGMVMKEMYKMLKVLIAEKQAPPEEEPEEAPDETPAEPEPAPPPAEPEDEKEEPEVPAKPAEETLTLSKMSNDQFLELAKQKGFQVVETTTPSVSDKRKEMTKRLDPPKAQSKFPSSEEMTEAMENWRSGGIQKLSDKYQGSG